MKSICPHIAGSLNGTSSIDHAAEWSTINFVRLLHSNLGRYVRSMQSHKK